MSDDNRGPGGTAAPIAPKGAFLMMNRVLVLLTAAVFMTPISALADGDLSAARRVTVSPPAGWQTLPPDETLSDIPGVIPGLGYANERIPAIVCVVAYDTKTVGSPETIAKIVRLQLRSAGIETSEITAYFGGIEAKFTWTDKRSGTSGVYDVWEAPNAPEVIVGLLGLWPKSSNAAAAMALAPFYKSVSVK